MDVDIGQHPEGESQSVEQELQDLYDHHSGELTRFASRLAGSGDDARDVVQEAFYRYFHERQAGDAIENPRAWLYRVAANLCRDRRREQRQWRRKGAWLAPHLAGPDAGVEGLIRFRDALELRACLARLKRRDRLVLLLYAEGLRYAEIADRTQIPKGSIGMVLSRALARLRKKMASGEKK